MHYLLNNPLCNTIIGLPLRNRIPEDLTTFTYLLVQDPTYILICFVLVNRVTVMYRNVFLCS